MTPGLPTEFGPITARRRLGGEVRPAPVVTPLCIFAAGRSQFTCVVRQRELDSDNALSAVCEAVPLQSHGWTHADIAFTGEYDRDGWPIWLVTRVG